MRSRRDMTASSIPAYLRTLALAPESPVPMHRQLYFAIREAILDGSLKRGTRLPSTRTLAQDLDVSRNTVLAAFEQLTAEGYLEGVIGSGSFVTLRLPEEALQVRAEHGAHTKGKARPPGPSRRGADLIKMAGSRPRPTTFSPGMPELAAFPFELWSRLLAKHWRDPPASFLVGGEALGFRPLREAVAFYLRTARAVRCTFNNVIIVSGAQQALDLAARVLIDPGDKAWVEEPGYPGIRGALVAGGAGLVPVPVDEEGLSVAAGQSLAPDARLACVSPSHQYPLGITMSLKRRLELLEWASAADAFVLEDDYDSEYRYAGRPLAALQGLDADGRVIYVGSVSKVMFPGLRLGYMVVPDHLIDAFTAVRRLTDTHPPMLAQPALAEFIEAGHLVQHIRRMRKLYAERQAIFIDACRQELDGLVVARPAEAGMHLVVTLSQGLDDRAVASAAQAENIDAPALSGYFLGPPNRQGLLVGYTGVPEATIRRGVLGLRQAIRTVAAR
ncbi:transcriptional regulator, GntR family [Arboricoccus pini]|uniref:Transcriptional regulator, GntR family n=1 Tax=Arboricoccus pini TaxID=1963835 RepID=A0A212RVQ2_9PROT|nr:PLP-dependent aminotransferase family protein [Arboricoccus pini]SNB76797.1 transcriptional regulator, GntR family [Arboricoccus pini]